MGDDVELLSCYHGFVYLMCWFSRILVVCFLSDILLDRFFSKTNASKYVPIFDLFD